MNKMVPKMAGMVYLKLEIDYKSEKIKKTKDFFLVYELISQSSFE